MALRYQIPASIKGYKDDIFTNIIYNRENKLQNKLNLENINNFDRF